MKKILVVDDDEEDLERIKRFLESKYQVETALNGAEAVDLVENEVFDLILLDIKMPMLDGNELLELIKENVKCKIAFVTIVPKGKNLYKNVDGYLEKPFTKTKLLNFVEKILKK